MVRAAAIAAESIGTALEQLPGRRTFGLGSQTRPVEWPASFLDECASLGPDGRLGSVAFRRPVASTEPTRGAHNEQPDQFEPDLNIVWGAPILIGDIQSGLPGTRMPDGSLIYATAAAGNEIYRGDRLPKDLIGDYLHGEVVARIVRRLRPVKSEG